MKKQIKKILVLLLLVVLVAGCSFKTEVSLKIDSNKDVEVSLLYAMDDEMIDSMMSLNESGLEGSENKTYTDEERWKYLESDDSSFDIPEDYETKRYEKNGYKGFIATKKGGKLDEVSVASSSKRVNIFSEDDEDAFSGDLFIKEGNKYKSNMTVDLGENGDQMESYESYGASFEFNLVIELPVKPTSNNATSVSSDGKTLTYNLLKTKDIEFEFELDGKESKNNGLFGNKKENNNESKSEKVFGLSLPILIAIAVGGFVIVIGLVILIIVLATRKPKQAVTPQPVQETPVENKEEITNQEVKEESSETKED